MKLQSITPLPKSVLEEIGFHWHTDIDNSDYIADKIVEVTPSEADAYYEAANELYDMYTQAGQYVIDNNLFHEIGVPYNLIDLVKSCWDSDVHWHLYSRFDFAGGVGGRPIKLLEFNADTPTALFETSVIQWALLKQNGMDESVQFNNIYEGLKDNFKRLITLNDDPSEFENRYEGWKILFSSVRNSKEEENTVRFMQQIAHEAGWVTGFCYMDEVGFDDEHGIFDEDGENYEFWFKLYPWEDIAINEPDLTMRLTNIIKNQKAIILNPAYSVMFHSKGMLKILKDLFPNSQYLLSSSFTPLPNTKQVEKKMLSREGQNVKIIEANGTVSYQTDGTYSNIKNIYQEFVELPIDESGANYQAGVFFAYEGIGLGYRKGGVVLDNMSKFVAHKIS
jgi:glutathionylspermidine synthase